MLDSLRVRAEQERDWAAVRALNQSAFETAAEADLVDALRGRARPVISLVAKHQNALVGHIMFSPVMLSEPASLMIMGLAPMSVATGMRRRGIGSALVRSGVEQCKQIGAGAVVVLGHPEYYPRFGFVPAARYGIRCEFPVPDEAFMVVELTPGYLHNLSGTVKYHAEFGKL